MSLPAILVVWDCNIPGMPSGNTQTVGLLASTDNDKLYMVQHERLDPPAVSGDFSINWDRVGTAFYQESGEAVPRPPAGGPGDGKGTHDDIK